MCYIYYSKAIKRLHKRCLTLAKQGSRDNKFNAAVGSAPEFAPRGADEDADVSAHDVKV